MSTRTQIGPMVFQSQPSASVDVPGAGRMDESLGKKDARLTVTVGKSSVDIYPWGPGNKLVSDMVKLARSNADVGNLLDTRIDFLFGAGVGLFTERMDGKDLVLEPYLKPETAALLEEKGIQDFVDAAGTSLVECGNIFVNVSKEAKGNGVALSLKDPFTVRAQKVKGNVGTIENYVLSGTWDQTGQKYAQLVPAFRWAEPDKFPESILQLKRNQPGQFYYGYCRWWANEEWIKLANRVPRFHNVGLDTEYNVGHIVQIAEQLLSLVHAERELKEDGTEWSKAESNAAFFADIDKLLFGDGKRKVLFDICGLGQDGKMTPFLAINPIKSGLTGKEYTELYELAVMAFANGSGILPGLAGLNGGKMLGGSGSELRVSAEYQQFYRTPRERQFILTALNRVLLPTLGLPQGVKFGFKNILLESLDKSATGSKKVPTA